MYRPVLGLALGLALLCGGCAGGDEIKGFHLTIQTGADGTDGDVYLRYARLDTAAPGEAFLDNGLHNDFEPNATDEFDVHLEQPIVIEDAGGLPGIRDVTIEFHVDASLGTDPWDFAAFTLDARLDNDDLELICQESVSRSLSTSQTYDPPSCP